MGSGVGVAAVVAHPDVVSGISKDVTWFLSSMLTNLVVSLVILYFTLLFMFTGLIVG